MQVRQICAKVQTDAPHEGFLEIDTESEEEGAKVILSYIKRNIGSRKVAGLMNVGGMTSYL
jgi:hypothetical protein